MLLSRQQWMGVVAYRHPCQCLVWSFFLVWAIWQVCSGTSLWFLFSFPSGPVMLNTSPCAHLLAFVCRLWCHVCFRFFFFPPLLFLSLLLYFGSSLCSGYRSFVRYMLWKYFLSLSVVCLFVLLIVALEEQFLNLDEIKFIIFFFFGSCPGIISKKSLPNRGSQWFFFFCFLLEIL